MDIKQKIIEYIKEQKFSTTEVADSLAKTGEIPSLFPVQQEGYLVGEARCIFTAYGTNYYVHEQADTIKPGEIALIFTKHCEGQAIFGDIVAKYIFEIKGAAGAVVQGAMRDLDELRERGYPIWCEGFTPIGCINKPTSPYPYEEKEVILHKYEGCILVGDSCGVVAIPAQFQNDGMIKRLRALRLQEDAWNYCIDELGWNTIETICDKRYLSEIDSLPSKYRENLELLKMDFSKEPESNATYCE